MPGLTPAWSGGAPTKPPTAVATLWHRRNFPAHLDGHHSAEGGPAHSGGAAAQCQLPGDAAVLCKQRDSHCDQYSADREGAEAAWRTGGGLSGTLTAAETTAPELGPDVEALALQVTAPAPGVLRVHITAAGAARWEVPRWLYPADSVAGARPAAVPHALGRSEVRV